VHYITAVRLSGGEGERYIASLKWLNTTTGVSGTSPTSALIDWVQKGNTLVVGGEHGRAEVKVIRPAGGRAYLRSSANGQWTDNLLRLPRF
jgi:hypothetical protein